MTIKTPVLHAEELSEAEPAPTPRVASASDAPVDLSYFIFILLLGICAAGNYPEVYAEGHAIAIGVFICELVLIARQKLLSPACLVLTALAVTPCLAFLNDANLLLAAVFCPILLLAFKRNATCQPLHRILLSFVLYQGLLILDRSGLLWQQTAWSGWAVSGKVYGWQGAIERVGLEFLLGCWPLLGATILLTYLIAPDAGTLRSFLLHILRNALLLAAGLIAALRYGMPVVFAATVLLTAFCKCESAVAHKSRLQTISGIIGTVAALLLLPLASSSFGRATAMPRSVLILKGGLATFTPAHSAPFDAVPPLQAEFGSLDRLLPADGWQVRHAGADWNERALEDVSVLMVINPQQEPGAAQTLAIRRFLARGGRLLVIGDHTDIFGIRGPLNRYLEACSIRFNYDSVIPMGDAPEWFKGMQMAAYTPPFADLDDKSINISVGASLTCGPKARVCGGARPLLSNAH